MKRKVVAVWKGDGANGSGVLTAQSGAFNNMPYSFKTRFENDNGKLGTNPEELIAAAHAGCFNMKLSFVLNEANYSPEELNTEAILTFVDGKIISIQLNLKAKVSGINQKKFEELAEDAKANCPISGVLNCEIILIEQILNSKAIYSRLISSVAASKSFELLILQKAPGELSSQFTAIALREPNSDLGPNKPAATASSIFPIRSRRQREKRGWI